MRRFLQLIQRLSPGRRAAILIVVAIIILTWLGVCAILATYPVFSQ